MNLRMIGLAAVVVFTALLPLAASAGPSDGPPSDAGAVSGTTAMGGREGGTASSAARAMASGAAGVLADAKTARSSVSGIKGSATAVSAEGAGTAGGGGMDPGGRAPGRTTERCGPEVTSPEGIEAQTCVLTAGRDRTGAPGSPAGAGGIVGLDTWARTYYRNETGGELLAVLSLMGPYGRTVQTHCPIDAGDEPAICETPREPSRGEHTAYMAVAEFSAPANSGNRGNGGHNGYGGYSGHDRETEGNSAKSTESVEIAPLLLRSGSNSPAPAAR
ncbi:hypothetical protein [Streptomyces sp. NPDC092295]|uniref:hypothetical protein n=1 Tax=Streptomyces sp. NPDC092295 TaxID=3366011 RepID=UPI0038214D5A